MLTEVERTAIETEAAHYPQRRHACIDALRIVQRERGWVSDEGVRDVAAALGVSPEEVDAVATFYNLIYRRPVGQHVILLCDSVSCWVMGYEQIRARIRARLGIGFGETTVDGRFTLLPIQCLGTCDHAPAMMVGAELYRDLTPERVDEILQEYAGGSQPAGLAGG
ncbi:MAG TPA: NADH-quinone oxidoreductase subunit NuoE [Roseiflexaceae bacterium]|nr:NADH-quinone oxidoreductase subunit NuoE [Roseiflexaceae bacterium]